MTDVLTYEVADGVATVVLNRPEKMNAISFDLFNALVETAETIKADKSVRAVVVTGNERAFCAGLDMEIFQSGVLNEGLAKRTHGDANLFQQAAWAWHQVPVPVIAAVQGACLGGGLQIISGMDMRYVHPQAKLSILEIKWGLVPDMAGTQLWRHYVRDDVLRELTYTGRIFSGEEAGTNGFATKVTETPLDDALATAKLIANKSPDAIRASKQLMNQQTQVSASEGLLLESVLQDEIIGQPNQIEAVMANIEKRAPVFSD